MSTQKKSKRKNKLKNATYPTTSRQLYECPDKLVDHVNEYEVGILLVSAFSLIADVSLFGLGILFCQFCFFAIKARKSNRRHCTKNLKPAFWFVVLRAAYEYLTIS